MNEEWDGEGLPPVGVECELKRHDWTDWQIGKFTFIGSTLAVFESESRNEAVCDVERVETRPLPPKPKKIDMAKFAGSDVWLVHINNEEKRNQAKEFKKYPNILREAYRPMFYVWNHWTGDSEPEWLEGFEYEVKEIAIEDNNAEIDVLKDHRIMHWPDVIAIKICGIKEGWEL